MSAIAFEPANVLHAIAMAPDMSPECEAECRATGYPSALAALVESIDSSHGECWAGVVNGEVACIFGLSHSRRSGLHIVWMLAAKQFRRNSYEFNKVTPRVVEALQARAGGPIVNWIHAKHRAALHWVERHGFSVGPPILMQPSGELFHLATRGA